MTKPPGLNLDRFIPPELLDEDTPSANMAVGLLEATLDELSRMSGSWNQLSKTQQDQVIERFRSRIRELTDEAIEKIRGGRFSYCVTIVEGVTIKKGVKATVELMRGKHAAIDHVGKKALLVLYDPEQYFERLQEIEGQADQPGLDLGPPEGDDPEPPAEPDGDPDDDTPPPDDVDDTLPNEPERGA